MQTYNFFKKIKILSHLPPSARSSREASTARSSAPRSRLSVNSHAQSHTARRSPASHVSPHLPDAVRHGHRPPSRCLSRESPCVPAPCRPPCTWRWRAGAASRPAHSGASSSAAARSVTAPAPPGMDEETGEEPAEWEGEPLGFEVSTEPMPELPEPETPDFWEGPQWEPLGFFVQYMWAFGVVFGGTPLSPLLVLVLVPLLCS
jgi:hypothetical protein